MMQVGTGALVTFPVESVPNRTVKATALVAVTAGIAANADSFGFWQGYEVSAVSTLRSTET
jgi:hypothetical protein